MKQKKRNPIEKDFSLEIILQKLFFDKLGVF